MFSRWLWAGLGATASLTLSDASARRAAIETALPRLLAELRASYGGDERSAPAATRRCTRAQRAWGLMPAAEYRQAIALCIDRDLRPRFGRAAIELARPPVEPAG
jgi:hypothetical protein